jgi:hypothetical protein
MYECSSVQGLGMSNAKLDAMIGMFHDSGDGSVFVSNVAAGSERAGFSGPGVSCDVVAQGFSSTSFDGNSVHSSLSGFWFDFFAVQEKALPCLALRRFTAWKLWHYGVYGELLAGSEVILREIYVADARVGVRISLGGHGRFSRRIRLEESLLVGRSENSNCLRKAPSLWTCAHAMAYCSHLNSEVKLYGWS